MQVRSTGRADAVHGYFSPATVLDSSCAGLTRASIKKNVSLKRMDCRVKPGNDGGWVSVNGPSAYKLVSLPLAMTGPVGCPVGDPPGGSSDTASAASGVRRPARSGGMVRRIGWPGWMSPSERGR